MRTPSSVDVNSVAVELGAHRRSTRERDQRGEREQRAVRRRLIASGSGRSRFLDEKSRRGCGAIASLNRVAAEYSYSFAWRIVDRLHSREYSDDTSRGRYFSTQTTRRLENVRSTHRGPSGRAARKGPPCAHLAPATSAAPHLDHLRRHHARRPRPATRGRGRRADLGGAAPGVDRCCAAVGRAPSPPPREHPDRGRPPRGRGHLRRGHHRGADRRRRSSAAASASPRRRFRKYVQQGLLPRSRRVGRKGKNKGSLGLYPAKTVRRIDHVKRLMGEGYTIEQIQAQFLQFTDLVENVERGVGSCARSPRRRSGRARARARRRAAAWPRTWPRPAASATTWSTRLTALTQRAPRRGRRATQGRRRRRRRGPAVTTPGPAEGARHRHSR
jgi:hypothetical protein